MDFLGALHASAVKPAVMDNDACNVEYLMPGVEGFEGVLQFFLAEGRHYSTLLKSFIAFLSCACRASWRLSLCANLSRASNRMSEGEKLLGLNWGLSFFDYVRYLFSSKVNQRLHP